MTKRSEQNTATTISMRRGMVALIIAIAVSPWAAAAWAGDLGRKVADSGPHTDGEAFKSPRIKGHKRVAFKGTSDPPQPITGTWSINCFLSGDTVFHRDEGLPLIEDGSVTKRLTLPRKRYDYCVVAPSIVFASPDASGSVRVQVFVRPLSRRR